MFKNMIVLVVSLVALASSGYEDRPSLGKGARVEAYAIAWCLFTECRGESYRGKLAVCSVVYNRAIYRGSLCSTEIFRPKQFSGVGDSVPVWFMQGPAGPLWPSQYDGPGDVSAFWDCITIGYSVVRGGFVPIGSYTHFYAHDLCSPSWSAYLTDKKIIGGHTFGVMPARLR